MVRIFTTPSCSSCRKAKKWLEEHRIPYEEKNLFSTKITNDDINEMLRNAENGFEDIISTRSKVFKDQNLDVEDMKVSELRDFIIKNPSVLKRPIIIDKDKMQVGYNDEEIRVFIPKRLREIIMCTNCAESETCDYQSALRKYFEEISASTRQSI